MTLSVFHTLVVSALRPNKMNHFKEVTQLIGMNSALIQFRDFFNNEDRDTLCIHIFVCTFSLFMYNGMFSGFVKCAAAACGMEINRLLIISVYSFRHTVSCPETLDCELLSPALTPGVFGISYVRSVTFVTGYIWSSPPAEGIILLQVIPKHRL